MSEWARRHLGDLLDIKHGYAFEGQHFSDVGRHRLITPGNFAEKEGFIDRGDKQKRYNGPVPKDYVLEPGALIVAMMEQAEGLLGSSAIVPSGDTCPHNQRIGLVCLRREDAADKRFLYYVFNTKVVRDQIRASASGVKVRHTSPSRIKAVSVCIPAKATQERIASILSAYDDLIEVNRRRVAILEEIARRLFEEWFVHLRFPGHETVPVHDTPDGPLPDGWSFSALRKVADVNGNSLRPARAPDRIRYVDIASVSPGRIEQSEEFAFADAPGRARRLVKDGSVIWSTVRPNRRGYAIIFDPDPDLVVSTGFAVIDAREVPPSYLHAWLTTSSFVSYLVNHATGAAYPAVTGATFERARVLVPHEATRTAYGEVSDPLLRLADKLNRSNARLASARDLLLPRLISGELSVTDAPAPERLLEAAD